MTASVGVKAPGDHRWGLRPPQLLNGCKVSNRIPIGSLGTVLLIMAAFAVTNIADAEPKSILILRSSHNLDYVYNACDTLVRFTDIDAVSRLVKNAAEDDPRVKYNKQLLKGISECKSVKDPRELGRRLEENIVEQLAANPLCAGVSAYIEGYGKYDKKFNEEAMQAEKHNGYWLLLVDYTPGSETYAWSLYPENVQHAPPVSNGRLLGEGTTSQIVKQICAVVTRQDTGVR